MIERLTGAALVVGAFSYTGFIAAGNLAARPRLLRALTGALAVLATEVDYGVPLTEALPAAARTSSEPTVGALLHQTAESLAQREGLTAGAALAAALERFCREAPLTPEDRAPLDSLAAVLGASGRTDQLRHLALCRERLAVLADAADERRARYERTARWLGVLGGAAVVLVLL